MKSIPELARKIVAEYSFGDNEEDAWWQDAIEEALTLQRDEIYNYIDNRICLARYTRTCEHCECKFDGLRIDIQKFLRQDSDDDKESIGEERNHSLVAPEILGKTPINALKSSPAEEAKSPKGETEEVCEHKENCFGHTCNELKIKVDEARKSEREKVKARYITLFDKLMKTDRWEAGYQKALADVEKIVESLRGKHICTEYGCNHNFIFVSICQKLEALRKGDGK